MITTKDIIIDPHDTLRARAEEVKAPISDEDKATLRGLLEYVIASQDDEKEMCIRDSYIGCVSWWTNSFIFNRKRN